MSLGSAWARLMQYCDGEDVYSGPAYADTSREHLRTDIHQINDARLEEIAALVGKPTENCAWSCPNCGFGNHEVRMTCRGCTRTRPMCVDDDCAYRLGHKTCHSFEEQGV